MTVSTREIAATFDLRAPDYATSDWHEQCAERLTAQCGGAATLLPCAAMKRRTLLQWLASAAAILPFERVRLLAQPRELTPEALDTLRQIAPTLLPSSLGSRGVATVVDGFAVWVRDYREGVPLAHGYGHPRLARTGPTPASRYITQLADLDAAAGDKGQKWAALDLESRRALLDASLSKANVRNLPGRPMGQHVVSDFMAFYFRSSAANDLCYNAQIKREICRPIAITIKKPVPLVDGRE
jgi:hypothetical protein